MTVYSMLIFDRHTNCCFFHPFAGRLPLPGPTTLPGVYPPSATASLTSPTVTADRTSSLPPWERSQTPGSATVASTEGPAAAGTAGGEGQAAENGKGGLAFDEEAKLIYGIIFSLRNMAKKLSGRDEDSFQSFSTSTYKLHYLHTPTSYHFILITSPMAQSLSYLLRQIYTGPFNKWVVRNPMIDLDSNNGRGVDNDSFRKATEKLVRSVNL